MSPPRVLRRKLRQFGLASSDAVRVILLVGQFLRTGDVKEKHRDKKSRLQQSSVLVSKSREGRREKRSVE